MKESEYNKIILWVQSLLNRTIALPSFIDKLKSLIQEEGE